MDTRSTLLVTGGAGYIGSVLVAEALHQRHRVRVLDDLTFGGESLLPWHGQADFDLIAGDVSRASDVKRALEGVDAVVHLAAVVGDPACAARPELARRVNGDGALLVFDQAAKAGVGRFVFASTCSNYGKMPDPDGFVDEHTALNPVSLYAELKVEFESYLREHAAHLPSVILRFATAYGLSPRPRFDLTVNEFTRDLALGHRLEVYGEHFWRPYCHVRDLAAACLAAVDWPVDSKEPLVYNVGDTSENYQKQTLVELITQRCPEAQDLVSFVHRDEDPRDYRVRCDRIASERGFAVSRRVPDGIAEIIDAVRQGQLVDPFSRRWSNRYDETDSDGEAK